MFKIQITKSADKALKKIPNPDRKKIVIAISALSKNPYPPGSKKLKETNFYRIRSGNYRVIYSFEQKMFTILVIRIGHRKEIYKK